MAWAQAASALVDCELSSGKGHLRMLSGSTIWYNLCGAYGSEKVAELRHPCTDNPTQKWTRAGTVQMKSGRRINLILQRGGWRPDTRQKLPTAIPEAAWATTNFSHSNHAECNGSATSTVSKPREDMIRRIRSKASASRACMRQHGPQPAKR